MQFSNTQVLLSNSLQNLLFTHPYLHPQNLEATGSAFHVRPKNTLRSFLIFLFKSIIYKYGAGSSKIYLDMEVKVHSAH